MGLRSSRLHDDTCTRTKIGCLISYAGMPNPIPFRWANCYTKPNPSSCERGPMAGWGGAGLIFGSERAERRTSQLSHTSQRIFPLESMTTTFLYLISQVATRALSVFQRLEVRSAERHSARLTIARHRLACITPAEQSHGSLPGEGNRIH